MAESGEEATHYPDFTQKKTAYAGRFAARYMSSFRPHLYAGETLGRKEGVWRNVSQHCLAAGMYADILADELGISLDVKDRIIRGAILHDWDKKHELLLQEQSQQGGTLTLETIERIKRNSDETLRNLGISEDIIALTSANIPESEQGPQTDAQKIIWYIDMMLANTEPLPIIERLEAVEKGWDGQKYNPNRAARTQAYINVYRKKYHGKQLNEVQRALAIKISQEFAQRIGYEGDPKDLPVYLKDKLAEKIQHQQKPQ